MSLKNQFATIKKTLYELLLKKKEEKNEHI